MKKVIISTDSPADVPAYLVEKYSVTVCPLHVIVNGEDKLDGVNVTPDDLVNNYKQTKSLPSTSAIPVGEYTEKFAELTADGAGVVHIALSSGVSSSHRNAVIAAEDFEDVYVVDSMLLTTGISALIIKAAHMAEDGMSAAEIAKELEALREKVDVSFVLDNLEGIDSAKRIVVLMNGSREGVEFDIPAGNYKWISDGEFVHAKGMGTFNCYSGKVNVAPISGVILAEY